MQKIVLFLSLGIAFGLGLSLPAYGQAKIRAWTDDAGRKVVAVFAGLQGDSVLLRLPDNKIVPYPIARLSEADQAFIRSQSNTSPAAIATAARPSLSQRTWPGMVEVSARSIEITPTTENVESGLYGYQSQSFEFTSQAKIAGSVMKEVARTFEATRALIEALPWGIACRPPYGMPRFKAALFETYQDYLQGGGPANSAGVYNTGDKTFRLPFSSLGLEKRGQTYFKNDNYTNGTLVHELTHQLMDEYLNFLPMWIIEGAAEYTEMLPYKSGTFRADAHKTRMKDMVATWVSQQGFSPNLGPVQAHMTMPRDQWQKDAQSSRGMSDLYHRSQLLIYYFCHLDGDKQGTRFICYMEAVYGEVAAMRTFFEDPRVKRLDGGRFSYPEDLTPPDTSDAVVFKHLPVLLDGRSYEQLAADIVEGFRSMGIKIQAQ